MTNTITIDETNVGTFVGPLATRYSYMPAFRRRLDEVYQAACRSTNRYFVMDGDIVRSASSTLTGAEKYMANDRVLVHVDIPYVTPEQIEKARQAWAFLPFRKCFVALKHGEEMQIILKPTAHYAGKLAREGWTVRELRKG